MIFFLKKRRKDRRDGKLKVKMTQQGGGGLDEKECEEGRKKKQKGMKEREEWVVEEGPKHEGKVYC